MQVDKGFSGGSWFATLVDALHEGVLVQDGAGRILEANRTASEILRIPLGELVTDPPRLLPWTAAQPDGEPVLSGQTPGQRALAAGEPLLGVIVDVDRAGERIWLEINSVPLDHPDGGGSSVVISSFRDITARVAADRAIRFQAQLLDIAGQAIIAVDAQGLVLYWNKQAEKMYGWSDEEALGRSVAELILPEQTVMLGEEMISQMSAGQTWSSDHWVKRRDGSLFPIFATSTPSLDDHGKLVAIITVATDITERRRTEDQALRLSAIVESSSDAIIGTRPDRTITSWNHGAGALFGYDLDEVLGQPLSMLLAPDADLVVASPGADGFGSCAELETSCVTKAGAPLCVSLSVSAILDHQGELAGLSCIGRDITDRKEHERQAEVDRQKLMEAEKVSEAEAIRRREAERESRAKSEFLSHMSHELRTPLHAVLGFAQILAMDDLTGEQAENLGFIESAGKHLLDLINDVLDISGVESGSLTFSLQPVHLNEVVDDALTLIRPQATARRVSLSTPDDGTDYYVHADRQRLLQVMLNLLSNAVKYNREGGAVDLTFESSGGTVSVAVSDTGAGMSEADLAKLFSPFERLGASATDIEGTGIGLALSRALSREMGGSLTVFSTVGAGSTFTLELPASGPVDVEQTQRLSDVGDVGEVATGNGNVVTVLAIEDDVANIRLLERAMQRVDHVVLLTAIQGSLGLELAADQRPDLILLDLHLPDIPGETVLERLRADPATAAIPVAVCSGDVSSEQRKSCLDRGAAAYLTKPMRLSELYELVEETRARKPLVVGGAFPQREAS